MSGSFGPCNKKLEILHRMKLLQKSSLYPFNGQYGLNIVVRHTKLLLSTNLSLLYRSSKTIGPQVYEINFQTSFRELKVLIFFSILFNELSNNRLQSCSLCSPIPSNLTSEALKGREF